VLLSGCHDVAFSAPALGNPLAINAISRRALAKKEFHEENGYNAPTCPKRRL
jgi:hypothetical protein